MLQALLHLLEQGGTYTVDSLARELGTTPAIVQAMLEDLERRGYLRAREASCDGACASCPLGGECTVGGASRIWSWRN